MINKDFLIQLQRNLQGTRQDKIDKISFLLYYLIEEYNTIPSIYPKLSIVAELQEDKHE